MQHLVARCLARQRGRLALDGKLDHVLLVAAGAQTSSAAGRFLRAVPVPRIYRGAVALANVAAADALVQKEARRQRQMLGLVFGGASVGKARVAYAVLAAAASSVGAGAVASVTYCSGATVARGSGRAGALAAIATVGICAPSREVRLATVNGEWRRSDAVEVVVDAG